MSYAMMQAALQLASQGIPCFPTSGKLPVTPHGFKDASTDPEQMRLWFEHTDYSIAIVPAQSDWFVVDVDLGADKVLVDQLPPTWMVRTPSGGYHYYYDAEGLADFGNKDLAHRINIRHAAGYVLVPPSPGYVQVNQLSPVPVPGWVIERLSARVTNVAEHALESSPVTADELKETLSHIDPSCDYNEWARVLAAISATNLIDGDAAEIALEWSAGGDNYCGDDFDMEAKLATFSDDADKVAGYGTLLYLANPPSENAIPEDLEIKTFTAEEWMGRNIAERAQLIGPISKTSRVMLVAPTGIGKTHVAMAIATAIASAVAWLPHWDVPGGPQAVLYIDGEMPASLMRDRIVEAVGRVGVEKLEGRLTFLNYADFLSELGGFPAMESVDGQVFIDTWLKFTGAKFVIFDNIQSLTIGDMKETDSWRKVQAFCRKLTDQGIGQLWVHHANKDGSMYGDKTRAYQFDTVISLKPVEDADKVEGELTFDLGYQKTRELHPEKTADRYASGRVSLSKTQGWVFRSAGEIETRAISDVLQSGESYSVSELCDLLDMQKRTVNRYLNGKWSRFVIPGSSPRRVKMPVPDMTF